MKSRVKPFNSPNVGISNSALEANWSRWEQLGRHWNKFDRVYTNEKQIIKLAEALVQTEYLNSDMLVRPSIPEFTVIAQEADPRINTYICYRKTLLTSKDLCEDDFGDMHRKIIPLIDAYVYINNGGTLCNMVVTLIKIIFERDGREITCSGQLVTYHHDDAVTKITLDTDFQFFAEFVRTVKLTYLGVQMLSLERPELISYGRTTVSNDKASVGRKSKHNQPHKTKFVRTIRFSDMAIQAIAESMKQPHHQMTCPCWGVAGHWRTYKKTGKKVWIEPYRKGKQRHNPNAYQPKNYEIPDTYKEVTY